MSYRTGGRLGLLDPMASTPGINIHTVPDSSSVLGMGHPGWSFTLNIGIYIFHLTWMIFVFSDGFYFLSVYSFEHVHLNKQAVHCFPRNLTQGFTCKLGELCDRATPAASVSDVVVLLVVLMVWGTKLGALLLSVKYSTTKPQLRPKMCFFIWC